jgi:hypothetical protein
MDLQVTIQTAKSLSKEVYRSLKEKQSVIDAFEIIMVGFKKGSMKRRELDEGE